MGTSRTWYSDTNVLFADSTTALGLARSCVWGLKALLMRQVSGTTVGATGTAPTSAAWTCVGSSDGSTAGMDNVDRWGSSFTAANIVWAAAGSAHSWIVLKSPTGIAADGPYYLLIDLNTAATTTLSITYGKAAFTGGDTLNAPTSTDGVALISSGTFYADTTLTTRHRYHICRDANGGFYFTAFRQGRGNTGCFLGLVSLNNMNNADGWRAWAIASNSATNALTQLPTVAGRNYNNRVTQSGAAMWQTTGSTLPYTGNLSNSRTYVNELVAVNVGFTTGTNVIANSGYRGVFPDLYAGTTSGQSALIFGDVLQGDEFVSLYGAVVPMTTPLYI